MNILKYLLGCVFSISLPAFLGYNMAGLVIRALRLSGTAESQDGQPIFL